MGIMEIFKAATIVVVCLIGFWGAMKALQSKLDDVERDNDEEYRF